MRRGEWPDAEVNVAEVSRRRSGCPDAADVNATEVSRNTEADVSRDIEADVSRFAMLPHDADVGRVPDANGAADVTRRDDGTDVTRDVSRHAHVADKSRRSRRVPD